MVCNPVMYSYSRTGQDKSNYKRTDAINHTSPGGRERTCDACDGPIAIRVVWPDPLPDLMVRTCKQTCANSTFQKQRPAGFCDRLWPDLLVIPHMTPRLPSVDLPSIANAQNDGPPAGRGASHTLSHSYSFLLTTWCLWCDRTRSL